MSEHDKLRELLAKATPGPWKISLAGPHYHFQISSDEGTRICRTTDSMQFDALPERRKSNSELIVAAVNALPGLLAHIEAQAAEIARLRDNAETAERHLSLYRQAVNEIDDRVEYARPHLTRAELHALLARLSGALLSGADKLPRATADAMRGGAE